MDDARGVIKCSTAGRPVKIGSPTLLCEGNLLTQFCHVATGKPTGITVQNLLRESQDVRCVGPSRIWDEVSTMQNRAMGMGR